MQLFKRFTLFVLALFQLSSRGQSYDAQRSQVFATNVISNALIGGIGGAINRDKGEKIYKAFFRNFLKGTAGGLIKYSAKYQTFYLAALQRNNSPLYGNVLYAPVNRLYFFLGHSVVMNAAYNRKVTDGYYCNFYGIDLKFKPKEEQKLQARLSIASLEGAVEFAILGFQFNIYKTLEYGQLMFDDPKGKLGMYQGMARFNSIVLQTPGLNIPSVLPHEIVHTYQMYDYFGFSSFYDKKARPLYQDHKIYKALSNYLVLDYETLFMTALYLPQFKMPPRYFKNYFEFEAEHFATRYQVIR